MTDLLPTTRSDLSIVLSNIYMVLISFPKIKSLNQFHYDLSISSIKNDLFSFVSSVFGPDESIIFFGSYTRSFILDDSSKVYIAIQRIYCVHSGKTHALIPSCLVPYSTIPLSFQIDIINAEDSDLDKLSITYNLDLSAIRYIRNRFILYWHQFYDLLDLSLSSLTSIVFSSTHKQFLQNRGYTFLFSPT